MLGASDCTADSKRVTFVIRHVTEAGFSDETPSQSGLALCLQADVILSAVRKRNDIDRKPDGCIFNREDGSYASHRCSRRLTLHYVKHKVLIYLAT